MTNDPYAGERVGPSIEDLAGIAVLAKEVLAAEDALQKAELAYKDAEKVYSDLVEVRLPELMARCGQRSGLVTADGLRIDVDEKLSASVPAAVRQEAFDWLDENGFSGLIKRNVQVAFTREQQDEAGMLVERLQATGYDSVKVEKKVEPSTLSAWARERQKAGDEIPQDLFTLRKVRMAKVTRKD